MGETKLVAAIACRSQGSRLYGKPLQNLHVQNGVRILDNIVECLRTIPCIGDIVLGVAEGAENEPYCAFAKEKGLKAITGDEIDVLGRLITCGEAVCATHVFRVTSESPFPYFANVEDLWAECLRVGADALFFDEIIDGCGYEILSLAALRRSHREGEDRHRSELCTLYIRENKDSFRIIRSLGPAHLNRKDLRLTVDNPEDLILARAVYAALGHKAPRIPVDEIVQFLDVHPELIALTAPFTEAGYSSMYVWGQQA